jgi:hypothetical protein
MATLGDVTQISISSISVMSPWVAKASTATVRVTGFLRKKCPVEIRTN